LINKIKLTATKIDFLIHTCEELNFPQFLQACRSAHGLTRREVCNDLKFSEMRMFWLENGFFKKEIPKQDICRLAEYYTIPLNLMIAKYQVFRDLCLTKPQTYYVPKKARKKK